MKRETTPTVLRDIRNRHISGETAKQIQDAHGLWICVSLTPPPRATRAARAAAQAAHHLLIPCRPALFNLASMGSSLNMAHTL